MSERCGSDTNGYDPHHAMKRRSGCAAPALGFPILLLALLVGVVLPLVGQCPNLLHDRYSAALRTFEDSAAIHRKVVAAGAQVLWIQGRTLVACGPPSFGDSIGVPPAVGVWSEILRDSAGRAIVSREIGQRIRPDTLRQPDVPSTLASWGLDAIWVDIARNLGMRGRRQKVGVIDTGLYPHPDFTGRIGGGYNVAYWYNAGDSLNYSDDTPGCNGHGTRTSGMTSSDTYGVANLDTLYFIKAFANYASWGCVSFPSDQANGLDWLLAHGVHIASMSLGGQSSDYVRVQAINRFLAAGGIICSASGNSGASTLEFPAGDSGVMAVGSFGPGGGHSGFSTGGPGLFISAPGEGIPSTANGGGVGSMTGTSAATPHCAGAAAVEREADPNLTNEGFRQLNCAAAINRPPGGWDMWNGCGNLNVGRAVSALVRPVVLVPASVTRNLRAGATDSLLVTSAGDWIAWADAPWLTVIRRNNYVVFTAAATALVNATTRLRSGLAQ